MLQPKMLRRSGRQLSIRVLEGQLRYHVSQAIVSFGLAINLPLIVAIGWVLALQQSPQILRERSSPRRTLIVLKKSGGFEDVENAFRERPAQYRVRFLPRPILYRSATHFLRRQVSDTCYNTDSPAVEDSKQRYRAHLENVVLWCERLLGRISFLQFNITYFGERELAVACERRDIPFGALHKEALWSEGIIEPSVEFFREQIGAYRGSHLAVYNATMRNIFSAAGVASPERVTVTGCARTDDSHRKRSDIKPPQPITVVYYLIDPTAGLPRRLAADGRHWKPGVETVDGDSLTWSLLIETTNRAIADLASKNPEWHIICKSKTGFEETQKGALLKTLASFENPSNIEVITGGSATPF